MKRVIFTAMLLGATIFANAEATNFSFTTLGVNGGSTTLGTPACLVNTCFSSFGDGGISGSYQFNGDLDWLILALDSSAGFSSGNSYKLTESVGSAGMQFVKAISDKVDIGAGIDSLSSTLQICSASNCASVNDTGVGYFVAAKAWINDAKNLSATIELDSSKYTQDTSSTNGYGLALGYYATKNNELSLAYSASSNNGNTSSSVIAAYSYHFFANAAQENKPNHTNSEVKVQVESPKMTSIKASTTSTDKLIELNSMRQQGLINDSEYAAKKKAILDAM